MTCHIDVLSIKKIFPTCVIDSGDPEDCRVAVRLVNEGKTKEHCEHWHSENLCKCCGQVIVEKEKQ